MFGRLMPFEGRFFELFNELAGEIVKGSRELAAMMASFDELERRAFAIETIEKRGDRITHDAIELLHKTFITPLDRDDIHQLVAQSVNLYDIRAVTAETCRLCDLCVACAEQVRAGVAALSNLKEPQATLAVCAEIDRLESEADHVMRAAMAKLSATSPT